ncbi:hypothetical protein BH20CHL2_BH20CHL2_04380 [soil metagenome]|jgi:hypothetical protein
MMRQGEKTVNTRHIFKPVAIAVMLATLLLPAQSVGAGAANINGSAYVNTIHYYTQREIVNNAAPGPAVVFTQATGPHNLMLGAWDCVNEFSYPWGGLNHQDHNVLRFVADGIPNGWDFCVATKTSSSSGGGLFSGYLQWD